MILNCDTFTAKYCDHSCCHMHRVTTGGGLRKTARSFWSCGRRNEGILWDKGQDNVYRTNGIQKRNKEGECDTHFVFSRCLFVSIEMNSRYMAKFQLIRLTHCAIEQCAVQIMWCSDLLLHSA